MITTVAGLGHVAHFASRPGEYTATPTGRPHLSQSFTDMVGAHNYLVAIGSCSSSPSTPPSPRFRKGKFQLQ